jgi:PIN domain nuclease of toxin-antitoxin system
MYLLDTSVVLTYALNPKRLGPRTRRIIRDPSRLQVSSVSIAEILVKQMLGKIQLQSPITATASSFGLTPLSFEEISKLTGMVGHDPFDRMITATAKATAVKLITSDRQLLNLGFDWILDSYR